VSFGVVVLDSTVEGLDVVGAADSHEVRFGDPGNGGPGGDDPAGVGPTGQPGTVGRVHPVVP
jgi:hypothetical protein